jgi:serine/threonine protein kinase
VIDKNSGNQYAAKFLRYNDNFLKEELMMELEVMALLDHPNITAVIDGYEDKKRLVIVTEMYPFQKSYKNITLKISRRVTALKKKNLHS